MLTGSVGNPVERFYCLAFLSRARQGVNDDVREILSFIVPYIMHGGGGNEYHH